MLEIRKVREIRERDRKFYIKSAGGGKSMLLSTRKLNKVWRAIKGNEQHTTSPKTKEIFSRTAFVVQTLLISSKRHTTADNNTQHG